MDKKLAFLDIGTKKPLVLPRKKRWRRKWFLTPENEKKQVKDKEQRPILDQVRNPLKAQ